MAPRTVSEGPRSAEDLVRLRAEPRAPGLAELVHETGLKDRWLIASSPVSMAYLERGEAADAALATE